MDKVWLITGANSGFGRAFVTAAVAEGDLVVATARRPETLTDLAEAHPGRVEALPLDMTDPAAIDATVAEVVARHGRIDVLVNNAGRGHVGSAEATTDAELRDLFEVHFFGPAALVRAALPHLRARRSGAIVQMSSMGGQGSFPGVSAYSATKFALEGFSEALAQEVAPLGIKVLVVEPGAFRTNLMHSTTWSTDLPDYEPTVGASRAAMAEATGKEPGDPAKAARAVIAALAADVTPLHLPLGNEGVDAVLAHLDAVRADVAAWEKVTRDTALDT
ncbi:oxidoreductase [Streptomyces sp. VRA16 Mangrove soil]|uniref:oxidoreductase n=1 Tax=Streptomyces sp. VRA16 Mangrove soil TaxID=2817434 RepID=UPI001A9CF3FB|nr:oxidoreductase [Streptomyces sp. VRA16 Mangrove soil]MBO1335451.1 SDR family NAD(P)-dependent oxidoreductase [Streptomyces sp. VRA16 Mangrove soil]